MNRRLALLALLIAAGCSKKPAQNYRNCLKLRIGMTREKLIEIMGEPEETFPYVEGKTLPHLKGRTSHEWRTPASMPAPVAVTLDDATGKITSARCADSVITAVVFIEPEAPALAAPELAPPAVSTTAPVAAPPPRGPRERGSSNTQSSGRPLTQ